LHRCDHAMLRHDFLFVGFPMAPQCHETPPGELRVLVSTVALVP
jgi:hypothetical protein